MLFSDPDNKLKVAFQKKGGDYEMEIKDFVGSAALSKVEADYCINPESGSDLSIPHSSSFIDLDGDCMPDIFLTRKKGNSFTFEIYIQTNYKNSQRYCLVQRGELKTDKAEGKPPLIEFADMDRDAMFDMIFYLNKEVYTLYNKVKPNGARRLDLCRSGASTAALKAGY